jgi:hypothetical protein
MTGGGDLDEILDDDGDGDEGRDPGKEIDPADAGFVNDPDPTAGASDIGGRGGDDGDDTGDGDR